MVFDRSFLSFVSNLRIGDFIDKSVFAKIWKKRRWKKREESLGRRENRPKNRRETRRSSGSAMSNARRGEASSMRRGPRPSRSARSRRRRRRRLGRGAATPGCLMTWQRICSRVRKQYSTSKMERFDPFFFVELFYKAALYGRRRSSVDSLAMDGCGESRSVVRRTHRRERSECGI